MRRVTRFLPLLAFLGIASGIAPGIGGCAHYPTPPSVPTPVGPVGMYPAFVIDPESRSVAGDGTVTVTGPFRACAATYVAPHLLVTSVTAFPPRGPGRRYADAPIVVRGPAGERLHVTRLKYFNEGDGIALVWTIEAGHPVRLDDVPDESERLTLLGFRYGPVPASGGLPASTLYSRTVTATEEPFSGRRTFVRFRVLAATEDASCAAPLIDSRGRLAGIVHERHDGWLSAISARSIAAAIAFEEGW